MPRKNKISEKVAELKKKEYDRKRRQKIISKIPNKKGEGQGKPISTIRSRERRQKRKN